MRQRAPLQYAILLLSAAVLTLPLLTFVLSGIPMRACRRAFGRRAFWFGHLGAAVAFASVGGIAQAVALTLLTALIGAYAEVEDQGSGSSIFSSAFVAVLATLGVGGIGVGAWIAKTNGSVFAVMHTQIADVAKQMSEYNPKIEVNVDALVYQTPSYLAVMLILALAASLIWEERALEWAGFPRDMKSSKSLREFRVPDLFVWAAILSILGAFGIRGAYPVIESVSMNALNVVLMVYLFQGIAVTAMAFERFQVTTFWRGFWYVMIAVQLHLVVSALGLADYWLDFRARLPKNRPIEKRTEHFK